MYVPNLNQYLDRNEQPPISEARYLYFKKPAALSFLPNWMFAFDFPHNVNSEGVPIPGCEGGQYCNRLPLPVFPTAFYETLMGLLIFFALWMLRKRITIPGVIFSIYLVLNGFERFFIEKIRVNSVYHIFGIKSTQAELIAIILILLGVLGIIFSPRIKDKLVKL
jgi:prolipoprotein diacylglyceryltransferase